MALKQRLFEIFERVTGTAPAQPQVDSSTLWKPEQIESLLIHIGQEHLKFNGANSGISQGDFGRVRFEATNDTLSLTFPNPELAQIAYSTLSEALEVTYEFSNDFAKLPTTVMVKFSEKAIAESLEYAHVDNAEPSRDMYQIGLEDVSLNEYNGEQTTSTVRKEVRFLRTGDILSGSGAKIIGGPTAGLRTPSGKVEVTVEYPNGNKKTQLWGKYTVVGVVVQGKNEVPSTIPLPQNPIDPTL